MALYLTNFNNVPERAPGYHVRNRFVIETQKWIAGQRDMLVRDTTSIISRRKAVDRLAIPRSGQRPRNLQTVQGRDRTPRRVVSHLIVRLWAHVDSDGNGWTPEGEGHCSTLEIDLARLLSHWDYVTNGDQLKRIYSRICQENSSVIHIVQLKHLVNLTVKLVWNSSKCIDNKRRRIQTSTSHFNDSIFPQQ